MRHLLSLSKGRERKLKAKNLMHCLLWAMTLMREGVLLLLLGSPLGLMVRLRWLLVTALILITVLLRHLCFWGNLLMIDISAAQTKVSMKGHKLLVVISTLVASQIIKWTVLTKLLLWVITLSIFQRNNLTLWWQPLILILEALKLKIVRWMVMALL